MPKPKTHTFLIVLPAELHAALVREARREARSVRKQAAHLIAIGLARHSRETCESGRDVALELIGSRLTPRPRP